MSKDPEACRLENLWSGPFGDAYVERNDGSFPGREPFWRALLQNIRVRSVLEVGCNVGVNLRWIAQSRPETRLAGVDINPRALREARGRAPGAHLALGSASVLPFGDQAFDLVFTTGVLIHIARADLPAVMSEVVRCSRRYVLCGEYHAPTVTEIRYREQEGALFKDDYGRLYLRSHPELALVEEGFLARQQGGWDDITYWLFEKAR